VMEELESWRGKMQISLSDSNSYLCLNPENLVKTEWERRAHENTKEI